jgi:hypothetical protein
MIVIVTPTIMDGVVVRWYVSEASAENGRERISVSRNGVMVNGYLHEVPDDIFALANEIYLTWKRDPNAWPDIQKAATHRRTRRGLEPVK